MGFLEFWSTTIQGGVLSVSTDKISGVLLGILSAVYPSNLACRVLVYVTVISKLRISRMLESRSEFIYRPRL